MPVPYHLLKHQIIQKRVHTTGGRMVNVPHKYVLGKLTPVRWMRKGGKAMYALADPFASLRKGRGVNFTPQQQIANHMADQFNNSVIQNLEQAGALNTLAYGRKKGLLDAQNALRSSIQQLNSLNQGSGSGIKGSILGSLLKHRNTRKRKQD